MNEDERRDLIARQHRALYGHEPALLTPDGAGPRTSQDARVSASAGPGGPSPLAFDPFVMQGQSGGNGHVQMPPRDQMGIAPERRTSVSPATHAPSFGKVMDSTQQAARATTSPSQSSPSVGPGNMPSITTSGVAPIGTRPGQPHSASVKRPSPPNERSTSAASTPTPADKTPNLGSWGTSSGVWGAPKSALGVQASVWG